jgi:ADP-ribosylglycohydrolase
MVGALLGAFLGKDATPQEWQKQVEAGDTILQLAEQLWRLTTEK